MPRFVTKSRKCRSLEGLANERTQKQKQRKNKIPSVDSFAPWNPIGILFFWEIVESNQFSTCSSDMPTPLENGSMLGNMCLNAAQLTPLGPSCWLKKESRL